MYENFYTSCNPYLLAFLKQSYLLEKTFYSDQNESYPKLQSRSQWVYTLEQSDPFFVLEK
jgi:hypothetical protein